LEITFVAFSRKTTKFSLFYPTKIISFKVCKLLFDADRRYLQTAAEKGASSWLAVLPLQNLGYFLNKKEFQDMDGTFLICHAIVDVEN
jgi:hypothetical protein